MNCCALANIGVLAKDRFWLLWMTPPGRTRAYANVSSSAANANGRFQAGQSEAGGPAVDSIQSYALIDSAPRS